MKHYEFWFIVGSQTLYGEDVLTTVANRAEEMAQKLSAVLPYPLKYKVTAKSSAEITQVVKEANYDDSCAGIVTWCHTFSPSKMWINGLDLLQKPWLHFATQYNREIPNEEIDMDFMNLNQAAHGDREHGFIGARLRKPRKRLPVLLHQALRQHHITHTHGWGQRMRERVHVDHTSAPVHGIERLQRLFVFGKLRIEIVLDQNRVPLRRPGKIVAALGR